MAEQPKVDLSVALNESRAIVDRICDEVWALAELSSEEAGSHQVHIRELEAAGFTIVSTETSGRANAFIAEWSQGEGGPRIGFLPEYDALPGLGNATVPRQEPAPSGNTNGHGCGHNLLGAGCTGAAIVLKSALERTGISVLLRVYGCAAEEAEGAKVYMARDGMFDDLDACLGWHPGPIATTGVFRTTALNFCNVEFHGKTAHAGHDPWNGRSALDAVELFLHGVNLMREHLEPTARTHYVIEAGGEAANIVPDYARVHIRVRDVDRAHVEATTEWVRQLADGAAMGTQTSATTTVYFGMYDFLPNAPLAEALYRVLEDVGVPEWSEEEQEFAKECQRAFGVADSGMATQLTPYVGDLKLGGSSDVGDVSWNAPTVQLVYPSIPLNIGFHTWPVTACSGMSIGRKAAFGVADILARLGLELIVDEALRLAAREDFEQRRGGQTYIAPLPAEPVNVGLLPQFKVGSEEFASALA